MNIDTQTCRKGILVGLILSLVMSGSALAHTQVRADKNDTPSPLDIKRTTVFHDDRNVYFDIKMYAPWSKGLLRSPNKTIGLDLDTRGSRKIDFFVNVRSVRGGVKALLFTADSRYKRSFDAYRYDDGKSLVFSIKRSAIFAGNKVRWMTWSVFKAVSFCRNECWDIAPRFFVKHYL